MSSTSTVVTATTTPPFPTFTVLLNGTSNSTSPTSLTNGTDAVSTSPTALPANTSVPKANKISSGAAAGIGVGAAVVGALLAFALIWLFRKREKRPVQSPETFELGKVRYQDDGSSGTIITRAHTSLDENLLDRADDSQIKRLMQDLNDTIDQHCENFYHLQSPNLDSRTLQQHLIEARYNEVITSGPSAAEMVDLLQNPNTRLNAIRRFIACIILGHVDFKTAPEVSLLPPYIANFIHNIPKIENQPGSAENYENAFKKWRRTSAFLLSNTRSNREAPHADKAQLSSAINRNCQLINAVLHPFIREGAKTVRDQQENLHAIIFEAAQLGLLLFSQPTTWLLIWEANAGGRGNSRAGGISSAASRHRMTVAFPALGEVIEKDGSRRTRILTDVVEVDI
ncbi:hypothetical protein G7Y89_g12650 [Cudoniella acicularis]|uniref:Uncharacterized protein n=1 Tax=Cudoniella acicularis TaxID=354080 RepID=A0A8H4R8S3_9HELO|nr:hypothetical protein G7Y89_g12650 [Cudoniella acicularis]